jgi:hypothetical protein
MCQTIADVNRTLRGWFEYFKHSHHKTFRTEDGFVRRRLRSILRGQTHSERECQRVRRRPDTLAHCLL